MSEYKEITVTKHYLSSFILNHYRVALYYVGVGVSGNCPLQL